MDGILQTIEEIRKKYNNRVDNCNITPYNKDAAQRLAYGLCKKYGIDTTGMNPKEAWEALSKKTGKGVKDFYGQSGDPGADKVKFNTASVKTFTKNLDLAKKSQNPRNAWRVSGMSREDLREWHPNAKLHVTDGGSTIAIDNGDIVGVCKNAGDSLSGKRLLEYAVKNGGNKLDSYDGNHEFYTLKCGFEPVSWCEWDDAYTDEAKKQGWDEKLDRKESIVFYKYVGVGKVKNLDLDEFKESVPASKSYDDAKDARDKSM